MDAEEQAAPIATKEGWRHLVEVDSTRPEMLTRKQLGALSPAEREDYADSRKRFMLQSAIVATPQLSTIMAAARERLLMNSYQLHSRPGLIVSGEPTLGKTTTVARVGRDHERRRRAQGHPAGAPDKSPVVYVEVPPACGPKDMLIQFAEFFALPRSARLSTSGLMAMVSQQLTKARTELVIVDEIHNLNLSFRLAVEASDALKQLSDLSPATFIYAGVNVDQSGLFSGLRGKQIAGRFETHYVTAFSSSTRKARDEWDRLLLDFETSLCLISQKPGEILRFGAALFARTDGSIGQLADVLHRCAFAAMEDGSERLSPKLLRARGVVLSAGVPDPDDD